MNLNNSSMLVERKARDDAFGLFEGRAKSLLLAAFSAAPVVSANIEAEPDVHSGDVSPDNTDLDTIQDQQPTPIQRDNYVLSTAALSDAAPRSALPTFLLISGATLGVMAIVFGAAAIVERQMMMAAKEGSDNSAANNSSADANFPENQIKEENDASQNYVSIPDGESVSSLKEDASVEPKNARHTSMVDACRAWSGFVFLSLPFFLAVLGLTMNFTRFASAPERGSSMSDAEELINVLQDVNIDFRIGDAEGCDGDRGYYKAGTEIRMCQLDPGYSKLQILHEISHKKEYRDTLKHEAMHHAQFCRVNNLKDLCQDATDWYNGTSKHKIDECADLQRGYDFGVPLSEDIDQVATIVLGEVRMKELEDKGFLVPHKETHMEVYVAELLSLKQVKELVIKYCQDKSTDRSIFALPSNDNAP